MNERIYELLSQAGYVDKGNNHTAYMNFDHEKFAELIIRECVQVAGDNAISIIETPDPNIGMAKLEVVKAIIRHFGVES